MKPKFWNGVFVLSVLASASGCGLINNLNEMHDSTGKMAEKMAGEGGMSDTMKGMSDVTGGMADTTGNLFNVTSFTYEDLRQGNSATIRRDQLRAMEQAASQEGKAMAAGVYFNAFEVQLWKNFAPNGTADTAHKREVLALNAVEEFLRSFKDYVGDDFSLSPTSKDSKRMAVYALAIAAHHVNPNQELDSVSREFDNLSILKIIEKGVMDLTALREGQIVPSQMSEASREVAANPELVTFLLQMRHTFLAAMTLKKAANAGIGNWLTRWELDLSGRNTAELEQWTKWMKEANRTLRLVRRFAKPEFDGMFYRVVDNMRMDHVGLRDESWPRTDAKLMASHRAWNDAAMALVAELRTYKRLQSLR